MHRKEYDCPEAEILQLDLQQGVLDASGNSVYGDDLPTLNKDDNTLGWN